MDSAISRVDHSYNIEATMRAFSCCAKKNCVGQISALASLAGMITSGASSAFESPRCCMPRICSVASHAVARMIHVHTGIRQRRDDVAVFSGRCGEITCLPVHRGDGAMIADWLVVCHGVRAWHGLTWN